MSRSRKSSRSSERTSYSSPNGHGWQGDTTAQPPPPREDVRSYHHQEYPGQSYVYDRDAGDTTRSSPHAQRPRTLSGDESGSPAPPVYDAPPPPAPTFSSRQARERSRHRRARSAQDGESAPLLQPPPPPPREDNSAVANATIPPAGILRDPRRSRTMSRDGHNFGLPPFSPGAVVHASAGGAPKGWPVDGAPPSASGREDAAAAAHLSLQHRSIRSSGIGATAKHRRSASANDGQTALLLQHQQWGTASRAEEGGPSGYGATAVSSPQQARPQRTLSTGDFQQQSTVAAARKAAALRRSQTECLPPVSPHMGRQASSMQSRPSVRSRSPDISRQSRRSSGGGRHNRPSPPPDASHRHRRADSADDDYFTSVTFEGADKNNTRSSGPLLPPRPRARTGSDNSFEQRGGSYMATLSSSPGAGLPGGGLRKPTHRRVDSTQSASSYASVLSMVSDMSVASIVTDISKKSKLFREVEETGEIQLHLPIDNIRLTMDPDLEAGTIYKQKESDEEARFQEYHLLSEDPDGQDLRGFDLDDDCACQCTCDNCLQCRSKKEMLPDVRYVINVDEDLYKRVLSEISDSRAYPCGLYYCGHHEDVETPSIFIAVGIVLFVFLGMFAVMLLWGPYE